MKGLSIKKLAAIGAGAALVGSAFAPIVSAGTLNLTKSDLFNDDGTPSVKVVVGSSSAPSDGVWAGNIAAAIAEQARSYNTVSVSGEAGTDGSSATVTDLSAKLIVGGTVTFSNAKTFITGESPTIGTNDLNSMSNAPALELGGVELTKTSFGSDFAGLIEESVTIKYNGDTLSRTFKEKLGVKGDAFFDRDNTGGVSDLEFEIKANDLNYVVDLGTGIPVYESTGSSNKFTDGTNDNILIPFLGDHYLVREVNKGSGAGFIRLIKSDATQSFNEGDIIPDLPGKNDLEGQTVSVRIDSVVATGPAAAAYSADVTLIDEEGNELVTTTVETGENINEALTYGGVEAVDSILYIDSIGVGASSGVGTVTVLVGTDLIDLYKDKGFPYDSTSTGPYPYQVDLTLSGDTNFYTKIIIKNQDRIWRNTGSGANYSPPLYPSTSGQALTQTGEDGESKATFLDNLNEGELGKDLFSVEFLGLESNEPINTVKFYDHTVEYTDTADTTHKIPLVIGPYPKVATGGTFLFDTRTIYYNAATTDGTTGTTIDVNLSTGTTSVLGANLAINGVSFTSSYDSNAEGNYGVFTIPGVGDVNVSTNSTLDINGFYFELALENSGDGNIPVFRADGNITFSMAPITSSTSSDFLITYTDGNGNANQHSLFYADANTSDYKAYNGKLVPLKGLNDVVYNYALYADSADQGEWYLLYDRSNVLDGKYDADIRFWGTDTNEDMTFAVDQNASAIPLQGSQSGHKQFGGRPYYWPDLADMGGAVSQTYYVAAFGVETGGNSTGAADSTADFDTNVYIQTNTGDPPVIATGNNLTAPVSDINYNSPLNSGQGLESGPAIALDEDSATTTQPNKAYNDFGTFFSVENGVSTIQVPDNTRHPVIVVSMAGSTSEVTGGEEIVIVEGDTGTTTTGTQITVDEITYTATCGGSGDAGTCVADPMNYFAPAEVGTMVYLDNEAPSGRLILVGGHLVNRLTNNIANIRDFLTAPGDGVEPWQDDATGNFVVAGYTANDTVSAARDFIESIEAIDMMG